jgi:hypothetical protein
MNLHLREVICTSKARGAAPDTAPRKPLRAAARHCGACA